MGLFDWLYGRSKIPYVKLTCEKCGRTYKLGRNAIVVTHGSVVRDFRRILVGGSYSSIMDTRKHPDLVDSCSWRSLERSTTLEQREELSKITFMLSQGEERWWRCNNCKKIQCYPPVEKGRGEKKIEKLKDTKDVEGLIKALKNKDDDVRFDAVEALGKIKDPRAVEPLIQALRDKDEVVQYTAATALGEIGDGRAVEPLVQALRDEDWMVQLRAKDALSRIKAKQRRKR